MIYNRFKSIFFSRITFGLQDVESYFPHFDKNNLTRWSQQGLIVKLRNGLYSFPEYAKNQEIIFDVANRLYPFSYISLHSALAYQDYIANSFMTQISSVAERKTVEFKNYLGKFSYQSMKKSLLFGYEKVTNNGGEFLIATPEKAILDLFYLYPNYYDSEQSIRNFALEEKRLYEDFDVDRLFDYLRSFENLALERRVELFVRIHGL